MKTKSKALLTTLCAVLLVAASVLGTMAYLTDHQTVTNTFTVGKISITLDEAKVNLDGQPLDENNQVVDVTNAHRQTTNDYKLMPGKTYTKDPTVHVTANSEDAYIFVKVENGIADYEAATVEGGYKNIATQITANGWKALDGVVNVYYQTYTKDVSKAVDLVVFKNFKIADNANTKAGWGNINANSTKVTITAYAIQKDGFEGKPDLAWDAVVQAASSK